MALQLRTLQTNRALRGLKLDAETEAATPAIADINQMTKQTRSEVLDEAIKQAIRMIDLQGKSYIAESRQRNATPPALKL